MESRLFEDLSEEEKMDAWHEGRRRQNIKACSDEKLTYYYRICKSKGYDAEAQKLEKEMNDRGVAIPRVGGSTVAFKAADATKSSESEAREVFDDLKKSSEKNRPEALAYLANLHVANRGFYGLLDALEEFIKQQGYEDFMLIDRSYGSASIRAQFKSIYVNVLHIGGSVNGKELFLLGDFKREVGVERVGFNSATFKKVFYQMLNKIDEVASGVLDFKEKLESLPRDENGDIKIRDMIVPDRFLNFVRVSKLDNVIGSLSGIQGWLGNLGVEQHWELAKDGTGTMMTEVGTVPYNGSLYSVSVRVSGSGYITAVATKLYANGRSYTMDVDITKRQPTGFLKKAIQRQLGESFDFIESRLFESVL